MGKQNSLLSETPAGRLKALRKLARLTRSDIEKKYQLPAATLKVWENGAAPITEKGLKRCIEIYRKEGVMLTREWILEGVGLPPRVSVDLGKYFASAEYPLSSSPSDQTNYVQDDALGMVREASFFKELYPDAIILMVTDDDMAPTYRHGDYVGGRFRYGEEIAAVATRDCIVRLEDGTDVLRRIFKSQNSAGYNLTCINPLPAAQEPVLYNVTVAAAAPIIWHRIPNIS